MDRVVTINLNGNAYQLDESAYDALRSYMARAEAALGANPDKAEIIRDLEQAIADKISTHISAHKSVVSLAEMQTALEQMGPVAGEEPQAKADAPNNGAGAEESKSESTARPSRKLFRIYDRHSMSGVSAGLAAYLGIEAGWVRALWILSALFTSGVTLVAYVVLMFVLPVATTPEDMAAAHGAPFNAQDVLDEAKRRYADFSGPDGAASHWTHHKRRWRRAMHERSRLWRAPPMPPPQPVGPVSRGLGALFGVVLALVHAGLLIAFLVALFSLITTGAVLGWVPPFGMPFWVWIIVLAIAYGALSSIVRDLQGVSMSAMTGYPPQHGHHDGGFGAVIVLLIVGWVLYHNVPDARVWMDQAAESMRVAWEGVRAGFGL